MSTLPKLLIASGNRGKLREIRAILADFPVDLLMPKDLGLDLDVVEDGSTYADNAGLKARAYCGLSGLITMADDSGLEVDALDGQPGLYSARYSPKPGATDADRRAYMLDNLSGKARPWLAHFHCTMAIAMPTGEMFFADGDCPGEIIPDERGSGGFGYDPIFLLPERGLTMAELAEEEKNRISHRARAIIAALPILKRLTHPV
jgi:XTP/dITP diphosphohydrolase